MTEHGRAYAQRKRCHWQAGNHVRHGTVIDRIKDVIFDAVNNAVLAFLVDEGGLFSKAKVIPFSKVKAAGPDAVTVENQNVVMEAQDDTKVKDVIDNNQAVKGSNVMTEDGKNLGKITDLFFNEQTGLIEGYEVSGGMLGDAYSGKSFLPATQALKVGEQVVFVAPETAELLERQIGGLRGAAQKAGGKVAEMKDQVQPRIQNAVDSTKEALTRAGEKAAGGARQAAEGVKGRVQDFSDEQVAGRVAAQTVRTGTGTILVAQGQVVTMAMVQEARRENKFADLATAVGLARVEEAKSKTVEAAGTAGAQLSQGAEAAGEGIKQAWNTIKGKVAETKDQTAKKIEEKRIQKAIGKPVTKVIYDKEDNIILNTGDLITHEAVERAREAGMLEALLDSVARDEPSFTKEELKA